MRAAAAAAALLFVSAGLWQAAVRRARHDRVLRIALGGPASSDARPARLPRRLVRAARVVLVSGGIVAGALLVAGPPGAGLGLVACVAAPRMLRRRRRIAAEAALESQLVGAVSGIGAALRAGRSLSQAVRFAHREAVAPLRQALGDVLEREELGVPLDASLRDWEAAASSEDVRLVAGVLRLRIGAGLPQVLDQVGETLRSRQTARRELRSLTAQARLSGMILAFLPIGFFLFLSATSRKDMEAAYGTPLGVAAIAGGLVLQVLAFVWIRRLVSVEMA
ncbi:MAG: type II secretion system F family protein [Actinomycetota bacterium]